MTNLQKWLSLNDSKLPRPLCAKMDKEWTKYSITIRLPEIGKRVIQENSFPPDIQKRIEDLIKEIPYGSVRQIQRDEFGDWAEWNSLIEPYNGMDWLSAPWLFIEFYFYRRILEAVGYFNNGEYFLYDPFQFQKMEGFRSALQTINKLLEWVEEQKIAGETDKTLFGKLLLFILEGNRVDLSLWPVTDDGSVTLSPGKSNLEDHMMVNDLPQALEWLFSRKISRLDILIDNAGFELLGDLCMVHFLLEQGVIQQAVLHVKPYPIFVSDVIEKDVGKTISLLAGQGEKYGMLHGFAEKLEKYLAKEKIKVKDDLFWAYPLPFWSLPDDLYHDLSLSDFIISKGDANYRRLLGDLRWNYHEPFDHIIQYMPSALLAVRVIKSDVGIGYKPAIMTDVMKKDPEWMKNGKWGCFQFWNGKQNENGLESMDNLQPLRG